jgi:hypothetical protein
VVLLGVGAGFWGCSQDETPIAPQTPPDVGLMSASNPLVQSVMAVQERHTASLMADPDIIGTATGLAEDGRLAVLVLATSERAAKALPKTLDGVPVSILMTDPIVALSESAAGLPHTARQTRPIQLGTSGGNALDLANGYCCSGTLGSLVEKEGTQYILSNSHVFAHDIVSSAGDPDVAQIGDPIDQPGVIDVSCQNIANDHVAHVSSLSTLPTPANVDCAIAEVVAGAVRTDGAILGIGTLSSQILAPSVNLAVKKSGRTTGLTRSAITGLNAMVNVGYDNECNGTGFTKSFTGQILIANRRSRFLNSGDSGSLMVESVRMNPRAVGLLYAGSSTIAVANPISDVLTHLGATMVGQ